MKLGPAFLLLCVLSVPLAAADDSAFSVKAEVDKGNLTVGEKVEYRVTITHDPSIQITSKVVPPPSDAFEVKEVHDFSEEQGRQIVEGKRFTLTLYELGEYILEPVTVRYRTAQGQEKSAETNRLYLTVRSVDASGNPKTDIRDVKGVLRLPRQWKWILWSGLILLAAGGGGYFWWRSKHRPLDEEKPKEPPLSPEDEALLRLSRLFDSDLIRRGKIKEYFLELSEILRHFFERRFEILAVESTTSEILKSLREKEVSAGLRQKIQRVLEDADLAKFAKWKPALSEITPINLLSKALVEESRPKPQAEVEGPAAKTLHAV